MHNAVITKSSKINVYDSAIYNGESRIFNLDGINDTQQELILIYMYILPSYKAHGIKVGMTKCNICEVFWHAIQNRIKSQVHELALTDDEYKKYGGEREVVYWGVCLDARSTSFKDYRVHDYFLTKFAGLIEKDQEWFLGIDEADLFESFNEYRNNWEKYKVYSPRDEQRKCVDSLLEFFKNRSNGSRFLLNCKMRFGKCYTTYKYCEEAGLDKILILTFVPAVEESWRTDLFHIEKHYDYYVDENLKKEDFSLKTSKSPYVVFLSLQNYLGKDINTNTTKDKIKKLQDIDWDLVILDEYHFGAWNQRTQSTMEKYEDLDEDYQKELQKTQDVLERFKITTKQTICLSGTPFKAIDKGEFTKENTFTYSYFEEQRNKYPNSNNGDFKTINPDYAHFPDMKIFGYNMSVLFSGLADSLQSDDKIYKRSYFSLNQFFETKNDRNPSEPCEFIYEEEIKKWLQILKGKSQFGYSFPYSDKRMLINNTHSLWLLPKVNAVHAMEKLLKEDDYFKNFQIANLSADGVGAGTNALKYLKKQLFAAKNTKEGKSIALTVNKLTIGVTVPEWSSVFVLKDLSSPEQYFQSIFRIQTPNVNKKNGFIIKKYGYVYDFNIDRASSLLLKYAEESSSDKTITKLEIAKLIVKYLPIYLNGNMESPIGTDVFFELALLGDTGGKIPLSRKITDTSKTTNILDEETIVAMLNDNQVSDIIKRVFAHAKFNKPKTQTVPPKPDNTGFKSPEGIAGRNAGYKCGLEDYGDYADYDDLEVQEAFENARMLHVSELCPKDLDKIHRDWWENGFRRGYESGVNAPYKKMNCGHDDGIKYIDVLRAQYGQNIKWVESTRATLTNNINVYLNDSNNIPNKYKGMLYSRWYKESFKRAIKNELSPEIPHENGNSIEDADNVLKHILARLFEFLYISVYRETTFDEIFSNANPDVFLEAVGITKEDFEVLNKYKIFQVNVLNNYIHQFFVNESLGSKLNLEDEEIKRKYRNSFDWFGFGIENERGLELSVACSTEEVLVEKPIVENKIQDKEPTKDFVFDVESEPEETIPEEELSGGVEIIERTTPKPRYYLAYGSNLNPTQMKARCPNSKKIGKAIIKDYRLMFKKSGTGYYLTIEKAFGKIVPVGVFIVTQSDENTLDVFEGCPNHYYKKSLNVEVQEEDNTVRNIEGFVYILHEDRELGEPSKDYVKKVLQGYEYFNFDRIYIDDAIEYSINPSKIIKTSINENKDLNKIINILKRYQKGLKASKIAKLCELSKSQVNAILYSNEELFKNEHFVWKLK